MRKILVLVSLVTVVLMGCTNDDPASSGSNGRMQVTMVDAPAAFYDSIMISVERVEIHASNSASAENWIVLNSEAKTYNLLSLVNGTEAVIGDAGIAAGSYTQLRLVLGDSCYVYTNGLKITLTVPSSEIKVNINADIQSNVTYKLVLDFDAAHSIVTTGVGLTLKPVIKVLTTSSTGYIEGSVNTKATVTVFGNGDTLSTITGSNNSFKVMYAKPGTYNLTIVSASALFYDSTLTNINVASGQTTTVGTINLRAKL